MSELRKVSLREKFAAITDTWQPRIVARINEFAVKIVKLEGEFIWHHHDEEDEVFIVMAGGIAMHYLHDGAEKIVEFGPGELLVVPHGIEHKPVAKPGTELMLVERAETLNTGNVIGSDRTAVAQPI